MVPFRSLRLAMKGSFGHLTLPALARESVPLHGPFPLASFGNQLKKTSVRIKDSKRPLEALKFVRCHLWTA